MGCSVLRSHASPAVWGLEGVDPVNHNKGLGLIGAHLQQHSHPGILLRNATASQPTASMQARLWMRQEQGFSGTPLQDKAGQP